MIFGDLGLSGPALFRVSENTMEVLTTLRTFSKDSVFCSVHRTLEAFGGTQNPPSKGAVGFPGADATTLRKR